MVTMPDDLDAAASAARGLASEVAGIRGLQEAGARNETLKRLTIEMNQGYFEAQKAIEAVTMELRQTRDRAVRFGDIVAPTDHEAALQMVLALKMPISRSTF